MRKYKRITIEWEYPKKFDNIIQKESMKDVGIYYITRNFGDSVSDLYIGKTTYSFESRLKAHEKNWLYDYRGTKFVRLGRIISPQNLKVDELNQLIDDAEKTLIFVLRDKLKKNNISTCSCYPKYRLIITNVGYHGDIPEEVMISDDDWNRG